MACSESKRCGSFAFGFASRLYVAELILFTAAFAVAAVEAVDKRPGGREAIALQIERHSADPERRPLLRQENAPEAASTIEISSRGGLHSHSAAGALAQRQSSGRVRNPPVGGPAHDADANAMPEDNRNFTLRCVDYPRSLSSDAADPISTGQYLCSGTTCLETTYPQAKDKCCNCDGGAQFRVYTDTQCLGDSGLSASGNYDGTTYTNPQPYQDVLECMESCWGMGADCTGISVVNTGSAFAGQCHFRKGRLTYIHDYKQCHNSTCLEMQDTSGYLQFSTTPIPIVDNRLPFCDQGHILSNTPCTEDLHAARPNTVTTSPPPVTVDDVVDDRDCFIKYLWWR